MDEVTKDGMAVSMVFIRIEYVPVPILIDIQGWRYWMRTLGISQYLPKHSVLQFDPVYLDERPSFIATDFVRDTFEVQTPDI